MHPSRVFRGLMGLLIFSFPSVAAAGTSPRSLHSGDTLWTIATCSLMLLMIPDLTAYFTESLQAKNREASFLQSYLITAVIALLWVTCGYSLSYSGDFHGWIGNLDWIFLNQVNSEPHPDYAPNLSHLLFMMRQCLYAVVTPFFLFSAFSQKIRLRSGLMFVAIWSLTIFVPITHWLGSPQGWLQSLGAIDFSGGMSVHMTAGYGALICGLYFKKHKSAKSILLNSPLSTRLIWISVGILGLGGLGMNSHGIFPTDALAATVFINAFLSTLAGLSMWTLMDWALQRSISTSRTTLGALAGIIVITSSVGYVTPQAAIFMGFMAGGLCNFSYEFLKFTYPEDNLTVFAIHGVAGTLGALLAGVFASHEINPSGPNGALLGNPHLLLAQIKGVIAVTLYASTGTLIVLKGVDLVSPFHARVVRNAAPRKAA